VVIPKLKLIAIKFNHDPDSITDNAMNIRKNASEFIEVPEWKSGMTSPDESMAAYAIRETTGNTITIKVQLQIDPVIKFPEPFPPKSRIKVRAVTSGIKPRPGILGTVKGRYVTFKRPKGLSGYLTFELQDTRLDTKGVGSHTVNWEWQYKIVPPLGFPGSSTWVKFATSKHRIFSVLEKPTGPWQQLPYSGTNLQLPWTEVLEYSCAWATGAKTQDDAACKVTGGINSFPLLSYTPATMFGWTTYLLTSFIASLKGGVTFELNCTDCADAVTTFANILGCNLCEGRFSSMQTWPFLGLGGDPASPADWVAWGWSYHEICWPGSIGAAQPVWDGCLQLDTDPDHSDSVHAPLLACKLPFTDYKNYLVESGLCTLDAGSSRRQVA
jgi:hypothetical protein